jgi:tetraacyldisaccharide 4'-kinase
LLRVLLVRFRCLSAGAIGGALLPGLMFSERELQQIWYGGRAPSLLLRMLSVVYAGVAKVRSAAYASGLLRRVRLPVPVVIVGNITAGGTGKTPLTIALVDALRARGFVPGVVSRGYGGSADAPTAVNTSTDPFVAGDEACLIARATRAPVAVGRDRTAAARLLLQAGIDVLIADDGLQHYKLCRDVEICVIDGSRRFGNGRLLPAGPLREPPARADACDFRVCNGAGAAEGQIGMRLVADEVTGLGDPQKRRRLGDFLGQRVHAVAGIGNPTRFFTQLGDAGIDVIEHPFDDHHRFVREDIVFDDALPVLKTQKDAVKCDRFAGAEHWVVPVRAQLPETFFDALAQRIGRSQS